MTDVLPGLIEALRDELKHYGEMLALLDQQQDLVVRRAGAELLQTIAEINAQSQVIQNAREARHRLQQQTAESLGRPSDTSLADIIPLLPPDYRPLVSALMEENNALLVRVHQRAHQNHLLLSRSLDLLQRFLTTLFPATRTTVYTEEGNLFTSALPARPLYEAIG